jgi:hypothetical protein
MDDNSSSDLGMVSSPWHGVDCDAPNHENTAARSFCYRGATKASSPINPINPASATNRLTVFGETPLSPPLTSAATI